MRSERLALLVVCALGLPACITSQTINVGQKTALERQLMGEFEPLTEEQMLLASVRSQTSAGIGTASDVQARALSARRRQLFNKDDMDELKQLGCVGESKSARVEGRTCADESKPELRERRDKLVAQENEDRDAIVEWVLAADANLTPADRPQIEAMYYRLLIEKAQPGDWVQGQDGSWARR